MITKFQIYESIIDPDKYFDPEPKFLDHTLKGYNLEPWFDFVWNINKKTKLADHISFSYKPIALTPKFGLRLDDIFIENDLLDVKYVRKKQLLTPDEFFKKYKEVCIKLYEKVKEVLNNSDVQGFRRYKYEKLLKTLEGIEGLQLYLQTKKYNL